METEGRERTLGFPGWRKKAQGSEAENQGCWGDGGLLLEGRDQEWEAEQGCFFGETK